MFRLVHSIGYFWNVDFVHQLNLGTSADELTERPGFIVSGITHTNARKHMIYHIRLCIHSFTEGINPID